MVLELCLTLNCNCTNKKKMLECRLAHFDEKKSPGRIPETKILIEVGLIDSLTYNNLPLCFHAI